jgi:tetratricopeptide (TPR) repeat protein
MNVIFVSVCFLLLAGRQPVPSTATADTAAVTLSKELEGLAPEPRIAYLRYLLETRRDDPEVYFQLGVAFQEEDKGDSALHYYEKSVELDRRNSKAYVNMGVVLDAEHKPQDALQMFEQAIRVNPRDLLAQAHAASVLFDLADYESAWAHLSKALAIDSLDPQPHFDLAIFFWESGMYRESLVEWEKVVSLAPGSYLARKAEENINLIEQAIRGASRERLPVPAR